MTTLRGGSLAAEAVYRALRREGQREPDDFVFTGEQVDFVLRKRPRALAIVSPSKSRDALLTIQSAALKGQGIDVQVVEEAEAAYDARNVVRRLLR